MNFKKIRIIFKVIICYSMFLVSELCAHNRCVDIFSNNVRRFQMLEEASKFTLKIELKPFVWKVYYETPSGHQGYGVMKPVNYHSSSGLIIKSDFISEIGFYAASKLLGLDIVADTRIFRDEMGNLYTIQDWVSGVERRISLAETPGDVQAFIYISNSPEHWYEINKILISDGTVKLIDGVDSFTGSTEEVYLRQNLKDFLYQVNIKNLHQLKISEKLRKGLKDFNSQEFRRVFQSLMDPDTINLSHQKERIESALIRIQNLKKAFHL